MTTRERSTRCRIAVLCNAETDLAHGTEEDALAVGAVAAAARDVAAAARELGHEVVPVSAPEDPEELCAALRTARPELVFNLCESLRGEARLEAAVAALLELMNVPFTGSGAATLALALDKPHTKSVLSANGVPTAAWQVIDGHAPGAQTAERGDPLLQSLRFPVIVKPAREDASHGIAVESVCASPQQARERARWVNETYCQPALVEEFIDGRELNISWLAGELLPLAEIDFTGLPAGQPRLVTFAAKWLESSPDYRGTPVVPALGLAPALCERAGEIARTACRLLGVRGYGRVDLRLDPQRGPLVLEVNPNPDLSNGAGFASAAARGGISYVEMIGRIVQEALTGARDAQGARAR